MTGSSAAVQDLAAALAGTFPGSGDAALARALLRELARGEPVSDQALAYAAERSRAEVAPVLSGWPNLQRNNGGEVVAFGGLSLIATPHRFEVDGRELFTWCAWDTLFLPALLGQPAIVRSTCPTTGDNVSLSVDVARVISSEPAGLQVSFPEPEASRAEDITGSFCCHVHFLAGQPAAAEWLAHHSSGLVLSLADAFRLGQLATAALRDA